MAPVERPRRTRLLTSSPPSAPRAGVGAWALEAWPLLAFVLLATRGEAASAGQQGLLLGTWLSGSSASAQGGRPTPISLAEVGSRRGSTNAVAREPNSDLPPGDVSAFKELGDKLRKVGAEKVEKVGRDFGSVVAEKLENAAAAAESAIIDPIGTLGGMVDSVAETIEQGTLVPTAGPPAEIASQTLPPPTLEPPVEGPTPPPAPLSGVFCKGGDCQYHVAPPTTTISPEEMYVKTTLPPIEYEPCRGLSCAPRPEDPARVLYRMKCLHVFKNGITGEDATRTIGNVRGTFVALCEHDLPLEAASCPDLGDVFVGALSPEVEETSVGSVADVCNGLHDFLGEMKQTLVKLRFAADALAAGSVEAPAGVNGGGDVGLSSERGQLWKRWWAKRHILALGPGPAPAPAPAAIGSAAALASSLGLPAPLAQLQLRPQQPAAIAEAPPPPPPQQAQQQRLLLLGRRPGAGASAGAGAADTAGPPPWRLLLGRRAPAAAAVAAAAAGGAGAAAAGCPGGSAASTPTAAPTSRTKYQIAPGSADGTVGPVEVDASLFTHCAARMEEVMLGYPQTAHKTVQLMRDWCGFNSVVESPPHPEWDFRTCTYMAELVALALRKDLGSKSGLAPVKVCKDIFLASRAMDRLDRMVRETWVEVSRLSMGPGDASGAGSSDAEQQKLVKDSDKLTEAVFEKMQAQKAAMAAASEAKAEVAAWMKKKAEASTPAPAAVPYYAMLEAPPAAAAAGAEPMGFEPNGPGPGEPPPPSSPGGEAFGGGGADAVGGDDAELAALAGL